MLEITLDRMLYPLLVKELKTKLLEESKECIRRVCHLVLFSLAIRTNYIVLCIFVYYTIDVPQLLK